MDILNKWIYTIAAVVVFVTFIEILMPNSSLKKYTKLILGLLVMTVILQPVFSLLNGGFSLSNDSFKYQNQLDSFYIKSQADKYDEKKALEITKLYKENLKNQIVQQVKKEIGDIEVDTSVEIVEDINSDTYGQINKIIITIGTRSKSIEKVEKVIVSTREKEEGENAKTTAAGYESLRNKISSIYDLDINNILICIKN